MIVRAHNLYYAMGALQTGCVEVYGGKITRSGHDQFPWPPQPGMARSHELSPIHCTTVLSRCNCTFFQIQRNASNSGDFDKITGSEKVLDGPTALVGMWWSCPRKAVSAFAHGCHVSSSGVHLHPTWHRHDPGRRADGSCSALHVLD